MAGKEAGAGDVVSDTREHETAVRTFLDVPLMDKHLLTATSGNRNCFVLVQDIRSICLDDHTRPSPTQLSKLTAEMQLDST